MGAESDMTCSQVILPHVRRAVPHGRLDIVIRENSRRLEADLTALAEGRVDQSLVVEEQVVVPTLLLTIDVISAWDVLLGQGAVIFWESP